MKNISKLSYKEDLFMKFRKVIAGLMAVLLIGGASLSYGNNFGVLSIQASAETTDSGFEYTNNTDSITITGYTGDDTVVEIPSEIDGVPVTSINYGAFSNCSSITEVIIPDSVISIGGNAFEGCTKLSKINLSNNITSIAAYSFESCSSLTDITIPDRVTSIGEKAFSGCSSLTEINIPDSVKTIGYGAFEKCTSLAKVNLSDSVTSIGIFAFSKCTNLTEITIPNSITSIEIGTFSGCTNLTKIIIPESVTDIVVLALPDNDNLTIYGYENSYAQTYAIENDIPFKIIGDTISATGDANGDDTIDINDVVTIMCYVTDPSANPLDDDSISRGDVYNTGDGINSLDALAIQKYLVKLIDSLPEK
jgi:hypothetical protein